MEASSNASRIRDFSTRVSGAVARDGDSMDSPCAIVIPTTRLICSRHVTLPASGSRSPICLPTWYPIGICATQPSRPASDLRKTAVARVMLPLLPSSPRHFMSSPRMWMPMRQRPIVRLPMPCSIHWKPTINQNHAHSKASCCSIQRATILPRTRLTCQSTMPTITIWRHC